MAEPHPQEVVAKALALRVEGKRYCEIERIMGIPHSTLYRWVAEHAPQALSEEVKAGRSAVAARATDLVSEALDRVEAKLGDATLHTALGAVKILRETSTEMHFGPRPEMEVHVDARTAIVQELASGDLAALREAVRASRERVRIPEETA